MWTSILVVIMLFTITKALIGDHVCYEENTYSINVTEQFTKNATVRNYKWCLNVPPRCSFYTVKPVNDTRIVEKEITDIFEKCCPGFEEDKNQCIQICPKCIEGRCEHGTCICSPGFGGETCDSECDPTHWGEGCKNRCECERGACDPRTGVCLCPSGWNGTRCESKCKDGFYGNYCMQKCTCGQYELCNSITGTCSSSSSSLLTTTSENVIMKGGKGTDDEDEDENYSSVAPILMTSSVPRLKVVVGNVTGVPHENNGKFKLNIINETTIVQRKSLPPNLAAANNNRGYPSKMVDESALSASFRNLSSDVKAKVNDIQIKTTTSEGNEEKNNYLKEEIAPSTDTGNLQNISSVAIAVLFVIIAVIGLLFASQCRKTRKTAKSDIQPINKEPPTFQNPVFVSSPPVVATPEEARIETHVVYNLNFQQRSSNDLREYLYDHPPSTGSYRAASIPEPPDIDTNLMSTQIEPLYDEIPSRPPPAYKSSSIYMNTCAKTRL